MKSDKKQQDSEKSRENQKKKNRKIVITQLRSKTLNIFVKFVFFFS